MIENVKILEYQATHGRLEAKRLAVQSAFSPIDEHYIKTKKQKLIDPSQ